MGELFRILREGGALGGLAVALVAVVYLFKSLHDLWKTHAEEAVAESIRLREALDKEKDAHRQTAMSIVGLSQDLARLLAKQTERRAYAERKRAGESGPG